MATGEYTTTTAEWSTTNSADFRGFRYVDSSQLEEITVKKWRVKINKLDSIDEIKSLNKRLLKKRYEIQKSKQGDKL